MNIGGLIIILVMIVGALGGMYVMAANMNMNAPVDSYGNTVSANDNATRMSVNSTAVIGYTAGTYIALIVGVLIMISAFIFLVGATKGINSGRGRGF